MAKINPLARRVLLFFARRDDEELSTVDIAVKYDVNVESVRWRLRRLIEEGMIEARSTDGGRGQQTIYAAGPALLAELGLLCSLEACAPVPMAACMPAPRRLTTYDSGFDMTV